MFAKRQTNLAKAINGIGVKLVLLGTHSKCHPSLYRHVKFQLTDIVISLNYYFSRKQGTEQGTRRYCVQDEQTGETYG